MENYWNTTGFESFETSYPVWEHLTRNNQTLDHTDSQSTCIMCICSERFDKSLVSNLSAPNSKLTRNLRFCFQLEPWALVCRWASVTILMSSHSSVLGSGLVCSVRTISSLFLFCRFSSIRRRLATRFDSSNTTDRHDGGRQQCGAVTVMVSRSVIEVSAKSFVEFMEFLRLCFCQVQ